MISRCQERSIIFVIKITENNSERLLLGLNDRDPILHDDDSLSQNWLVLKKDSLMEPLRIWSLYSSALSWSLTLPNKEQQVANNGSCFRTNA
jgi:hypothetical protein